MSLEWNFADVWAAVAEMAAESLAHVHGTRRGHHGRDLNTGFGGQHRRGLDALCLSRGRCQHAQCVAVLAQ